MALIPPPLPRATGFAEPGPAVKQRTLPVLALSLLLAGGCFSANHESTMKKIPRTTEQQTGHSAVFLLGQPWSEAPESGMLQTEVRLSWAPDFLQVEADLEDDDVRSEATEDNQEMWLLGDVFELFLMVEGRSDYLELHVTPNGKRMHLDLPGVGGRHTQDSEPLEFEEMLVEPPGFNASVTEGEDGWRATVAIPPAALGLDAFEPGLELRISFCRYDAAADREPVLSTTAAHPVISFHRPDEWQRIILEKRPDTR